MKSTGEIIKELRKQKGMTQEELGKVLGVQKSAIAKYENDHVVNLKRETIEKMATLFGVKPSYILGLDQNERKPTNTALIELFSKLTPDQQDTILAMMEALVARNTK